MKRKIRFFCYAGYSYSDETIDSDGGSFISDQLVESVFFNLRYYVDAKWGIMVAGDPEYRESED